ncbi:MAG: UDP-3-O-[Thermoguttaceae bacterium]|nr:UDP-3-O-[3-hydroxymyristoyl] N-acetylglucosamine deacetylase [Thermoguttaceae bacterium]
MQKTLNKPVSLEGFGFWRCDDVVVTLTPADPDTGVVFIRDDIPSAPKIPARLENRMTVERRTSLGIQNDGKTIVQVDMVEHLMAALFAAGITNCCVRVNSQELPALDGSALPYVDAINSVGTVEQPGERKRIRVTQSIRVGTDKSYLEVEPPKPEDLTSTICYELDYPHCSDIGKQVFSAEFVPDVLQKEIAPARTFATQDEAKVLQSAGLCQRVSPQNCLVFTGTGVLENQLRFPNECARHKVLDFTGDLYLGGIEWTGRFHGVGSGHALNCQLLEKLLQSVTRRQE